MRARYFHLYREHVNIEKYKTKILPFVSNGRETWILTLREEYKVRIFENRVLRTIVRSKRVEVKRD
jgi:hypothetical protein